MTKHENDFTKEELENIVELINDVHKGSQAHGFELHFDLRDKIQSMIDNYKEKIECKHEWVSLFVIDEENLRVLGGVGYKCFNCKKLIPSEWGEI